MTTTAVDIPYTTPEEDPFNRLPCALQPRRRRSSLLDRWIEEQRKSSEQDPPPEPPKSQQYPEISKQSHPSRDDIATLDNYDLVNDDDIPQPNADNQNDVTTPTKRASKVLPSPRSIRSFKPFRSISPTASPSPDATSHRAKFSLLSRASRHASEVTHKTPLHQHNRSTSLSALDLTGKDVTNISVSSKWRPSILGHFASSSMSQTSVPSDTEYTQSRPSISSGDTITSSEYDLPMTPSRLNLFDSIRLRTKPIRSLSASTSATRSSDFLHQEKSGDPSGRPTTQSRPYQGSTLAYDLSDDDDDDDQTCHAVVQTKKPPDPTRPQIAYSSGRSTPRVSLASLNPRHRKKKRLVISGVGPRDGRKFEGVKRWCESFGEVNQIVRMPNGDLHVHFRLAEVADTVCRVRARVCIAKVGSVQLSWLTGDQR